MPARNQLGTIFFTLFILVLFSSACSFNEPIPVTSDKSNNELAANISFQEYLWKEHPLDLIIQIGLLLAGAFGVAALLPSPDEE